MCMQNHIDVSILIVHYLAKKETLACIASVIKYTKRVTYEIILVDNDEEKTIEKELRVQYPSVRYIMNKNNGWGGGVNKGAAIAQGKYLYFLNPDTILLNNALQVVFGFAEQNENIGIVASLLFDKTQKPYVLQGSQELTPMRALVVYSVLSKMLPRNKIYQNFYAHTRDEKGLIPIEIPPLAASLVMKAIFEEAGGFDENFFLYFEEYDFGKRVRRLGYQNYIHSESKVIHLWGVSTKIKGTSGIVFLNSRKSYFKKYYPASAWIISLALNIRLRNLLQ